MADFIYSISDENGFLDCKTALKVASYHYLREDFLSDFREYIRNNTDINADLLIRWLGY